MVLDLQPRRFLGVACTGFVRQLDVIARTRKDIAHPVGPVMPLVIAASLWA
jgi:hypothetical protein